MIRNAGGVLTDDVIRSLSISQHYLGTEEVVLLHHTDCGLLRFTDEEFAAARERSIGQRPPWHARTFGDLEQEFATASGGSSRAVYPSQAERTGFRVDVESGRVREVGQRMG